MVNKKTHFLPSAKFDYILWYINGQQFLLEKKFNIDNIDFGNWLESRLINVELSEDMLNKENMNMNMNMELFNKIDYDVENGYSKKECIEKWGKDVIKEYEKFGVENDLFETDLEEWEEWNKK